MKSKASTPSRESGLKPEEISAPAKRPGRRVRQVKRALAMTLLLAALAGNLAASAASDTEQFQQGLSLYNQKQYFKARDIFIGLVCKDERNWKAQYQLGNIYLKLNDPVAAEMHYRNCLDYCQESLTRQRCTQALAQLDSALDAQQANSLGAPGSDAANLTNEVSSEQAQEEARAGQDAKRHQEYVMQHAKAQAEQIKAEAKQHIEDLKEQTGARQRQFNPKTGNMDGWIPYEQEQAILKEADTKANQVMQQAKHQASQIKPESPSTLEGLRSQMYGGGNSGVRLKQQGTNFYIRNYESTGHKKLVAGSEKNKDKDSSQ